MNLKGPARDNGEIDASAELKSPRAGKPDRG